VTRFLIVRHGQSVWNAAGRWQGQADSPLTDLGHTQARHAGAALPNFDLLAASTLQRAHQTAEGMAAVLGVTDIRLDPRFMERDAGGFSGLTREEIDREYPGYLDSGRWPDGWEEAGALVDRVRLGLDALATDHPAATIVIISHGGVIYSLEELLGLRRDRISNLGGRWFAQTPGGELTVGERVHLLDAAEETVPDQL
jgi:broad specificity phosphatase PhoE